VNASPSLRQNNFPYEITDPYAARALDSGPSAWQLEYAAKAAAEKDSNNLGNFAWVASRDLPIECPYPYPYMPVPQEDYASGRWLEAGYVPSIQLPAPFDSVPWTCGLAPDPWEERKGKGKAKADQPPDARWPGNDLVPAWLKRKINRRPKLDADTEAKISEDFQVQEDRRDVEATTDQIDGADEEIRQLCPFGKRA